MGATTVCTAALEVEHDVRYRAQRYGMVRARESILPFDLVVTGSLPDLNIAAYPKMRPPRRTPDAFLYR